jgi:hypothetical protein
VWKARRGRARASGLPRSSLGKRGREFRLFDTRPDAGELRIPVIEQIWNVFRQLAVWGNSPASYSSSGVTGG